ncbi:hypothetical protein Tco_1259415 [Tanacetum coccineum]
MTKVIKGEFEKLESLKISDVLLTCNTSIEIFNEELNRMSRTDDDMFTYEVEIAEVFPLSLADDARQWWINEGEGKITTWKSKCVKIPYCKFYPESHDGKDEMLDERDNWGIDPLEFISRVNSSFENHMKVDVRTKKESDYGNPLNNATDSFFKAHDEHDIEEGNELIQIKHKKVNKNDEQPNKRDVAGKEIDEVGEVSII